FGEECLSIPAVWRIAQGKKATPDENKHLEKCDFCRQTIRRYSAQIALETKQAKEEHAFPLDSISATELETSREAPSAELQRTLVDHVVETVARWIQGVPVLLPSFAPQAPLYKYTYEDQGLIFTLRQTANENRVVL